MNRDALLTPPEVCGRADVRLAHEQMRVHRSCRVERCVWKAAAYHTLVSAGRLTPQTVSPRERAAARGVQFPPLDEPGRADWSLVAHTLQEVLKRLSELATPPESCRR
ncbi:hypothetical protein OHB12_18180 [Nocardia sp. NBC_01730]|uniref:hypothetical protein n=1 Tax=Nocardia sp. NBC_01730 TaxID=2975998 RepID=UPI002E151421|nr:hypothetical protein OHB12_18180 [Nocardia sp. NBC_01730]